jgi:two-component system NtrC family response regulator
MRTILVVDDEAKLLEVLAAALENMGYASVTAGSVEEALEALQRQEIHLILSDLRLPGMSGRDLLEKVRARDPGLPVVIMTAYATLKDAVEIIKEGAFDYIVKPFDLDALEATVTSALRFRALSDDNRQLRRELGKTFADDGFVGQSPAILAVRRSIREVGASAATVLITGESGTGKEVAAKAIHYSGPRASAPFVTVNCAAIPETLLESELFGHVRGAFTGATSSRPGRFSQADSGSLFLDEIGDMSLLLQAKMLRCIQEKTIEPVGANAPRKVDVRIIAATNRDLAAAINEGSFRQDLYYRLNVYPIFLPPLRERVEDIPLLAGHFAGKFAAEMGIAPVTFTEEALRVMREYAWPGNIRELENCVERLSIVMPGGRVTPEQLAVCSISCGSQDDAAACPTPGKATFPLDLDRRLEELERDLIVQALEASGGVQVKAAGLLRISERSIWHRIKKLGIAILNKREFI